MTSKKFSQSNKQHEQKQPEASGSVPTDDAAKAAPPVAPKIDPDADVIMKIARLKGDNAKLSRAADAIRKERDELAHRVESLERLTKKLQEALEAVPEVEEKIEMAPGTKYLQIRSFRKNGFWRCGYHFGLDPVDIPLTDLSPEEVEILKAEQNISVRELVA